MFENRSTKEVLMRRKSFWETSTTTGELTGFPPGTERALAPCFNQYRADEANSRSDNIKTFG